MNQQIQHDCLFSFDVATGKGGYAIALQDDANIHCYILIVDNRELLQAIAWRMSKKFQIFVDSP
nr:hypothetical protein [Nostoc sp. ChiSLP03a]MDZ8211358.1 hypothetical protein [Nostoc sp. ChiSLP03a]